MLNGHQLIYLLSTLYLFLQTVGMNQSDMLNLSYLQESNLSHYLQENP